MRTGPRHLTQKPAWMRDALCLEYPARWWFVNIHESGKRAKDVCCRCLVREECLAFAIEHSEKYGLWAGFDHHDFARWRRYRECRLCHEPIPIADVAALVIAEVEPRRWCCRKCREICIRGLGVAV